MVIRTSAILLGLLCYGSAYRILCLFPYPGKSHQMVFDPLLDELVNQGHDLTVVSFFPSGTLRANRRDVSLVGLAPIAVEVIDLNDFEKTFFGLEKYYEHIPMVQHLAKSNLKLCERLLTSPIMSEFVNGKGRYDLIILEHFNSDCMLGLVHVYGVPSVGLMSHTILPWTPSRHGFPDNPAYVPGMLAQLTDEMDFLGRVENTLALYFYKVWFEYEIRVKEQELLERVLGRKLPPLEEVGKNTSVLLMNTHPSLNGAKALVPAVVEVGGLHLHNRAVNPLPQQLEEFVAGATDGVILFSFGSLIRGSSLPRHRLEAFLKVFARLPQRVVWKWENASIDGLPDNVLVQKWLPQYDLLHHKKCIAFISHGGLLSMTEAAAAGVPMLVVPVLGDQFGNAAHAQRAGLATTLRYTDITEDHLYDALQEVLSAQMRVSARRLGAEWSDREAAPMATAVYWVSRAARAHQRRQPPYASHARFLPLYQTALLDVIAFLTALAVLLLMISYYSIKVVLRRLTTTEKMKIS